MQSSKNPFLDWDALSPREPVAQRRRDRRRDRRRHGTASRSGSSRAFSVTRDQATLVMSGRRDREDGLRRDRRHRESDPRVDPRRRRSRRRSFAAKDAKGLDAPLDRRRPHVRVCEAGRSVRAQPRRDGGEEPDAEAETAAAQRRRTPDPKPVITPDEKKETETTESFSAGAFSRDGSRLIATSSKGWYVVNVADGDAQADPHARQGRGEEPAGRACSTGRRMVRRSTRTGAHATSGSAASPGSTRPRAR